MTGPLPVQGQKTAEFTGRLGGPQARACIVRPRTRGHAAERVLEPRGEGGQGIGRNRRCPDRARPVRIGQELGRRACRR